ncbi:MAG TPA: VOC family protein [Pseudolabrys sp.]|jgi:PhnB protein|nr:VOC family protein [Pseudolabrys sp.]
MQVQPYLFFDGRCDEAIEFYKAHLGATVEMLMRYKEAPDQSRVTPESRDKIMHASLRIGDTRVLASDGHCAGKPNFQGFSLAVTAKDEADAERIFKGLSAEGEVRMPMEKTFFSPRFGMVADKFGVGWMVMAPAK